MHRAMSNRRTRRRAKAYRHLATALRDELSS
jgi:hypothetical protein